MGGHAASEDRSNALLQRPLPTVFNFSSTVATVYRSIKDSWAAAGLVLAVLVRCQLRRPSRPGQDRHPPAPAPAADIGGIRRGRSPKHTSKPSRRVEDQSRRGSPERALKPEARNIPRIEARSAPQGQKHAWKPEWESKPEVRVEDGSAHVWLVHVGSIVNYKTITQFQKSLTKNLAQFAKLKFWSIWGNHWAGNNLQKWQNHQKTRIERSRVAAELTAATRWQRLHTR